MRIRLGRSRPHGSDAAQDALTSAEAAGDAASERLASATETRASAERQAASEQAGIISDLRQMRRKNNLAQMVLDSVEGKRH